MPEDELVNLSEEDLRWFFNVNKIVRRPEEKKKGFSLRLNKSHPVGSV